MFWIAAVFQVAFLCFPLPANAGSRADLQAKLRAVSLTSSSIAPVDLKTESSVNPLGIDAAQPRLSWKLAARSAGERGLAQSAYRIRVAGSLAALARGQGELWDSGKVASSRTFAIAYAGKALSPSQSCYWDVAVWDQAGRQSAWSKPAHWTTGLMKPGDWSAKWIAATPDGPPPPHARENTGAFNDHPQPLPLFRRDFSIDKPIARAIIYVAGLGQYELHMNGAKVTDTVLNPGWTDYRKTVFYNSWDVTRLLKPGANALGVMLGNGMYNVEGTKGRYTKFIGTFGQPKLLLQMQIDFQDGSIASVISDKSWKTAAGPITYSSIYGGEDYDARREQPGWDKPAGHASGFQDSTWTQSLEVSGPGGQLVAQTNPPLKIAQVFTPRAIREPRPGVKVYDLGQNFSGWPEIAVRGPRGSTVHLLAGELLDKEGMVTQRSAGASPDDATLFTYTLRGAGVEHWHPRFTSYGFRYVQVSGAARNGAGARPAVLSLSGQFIHADAQRVGTFSTSNALFMRIHRLIDMAIASNMASILTDCPHREKLGWLEQTYLNGSSILYNYDLAQLYSKIGRDMRDAQLSSGLVPSIAPEFVAFVDGEGQSTSFRDSPEWGSAMILSPWTAYQFNGDPKPLEDNYRAMTAYAGYLRSRAMDNMLTYGLGDWYDIGPAAPGYSQLTPEGVTATAIYYQDLLALAGIDAVLGNQADGSAFRRQASSVRDAFNAHLLKVFSGTYGTGSQTANAMPLALGLVPENLKTQVLDHLVADIRDHHNHVTAGDIGFHYVVRALTNAGRSDVLSDMLLRTDSPSYGYQLAQGATTLTEAWDANPDSSQNHFMLGQAEEWFYRGLAGIDFDLSRPSPQQIVIRPAFVQGTRDASASYDSVLGKVACRWRRTGTRIDLYVTIPPGASATVYIPEEHGKRITESGSPLPTSSAIVSAAFAAGSTQCVVRSGQFHFSFPVNSFPVKQ